MLGPAETPTIAIVDDDAAVRAALLRLMDAADYEAQGFASAEEFLGSPSLASFGCLIVDVFMPGMGGLELQRRMVASGSKTPIVFMSAHADEQTRAHALRAGAVAFFFKPFDNDALLDTVEAARAKGGPGKDGRPP